MKILITGDRNYKDNGLMEKMLWDIRLLLNHYEDITIIHGDASGADSIAKDVAKKLGFESEEFKADWEKFGLAAGPKRNGIMVREKPDMVIAFHDEIWKSKGTKDCVKQARKAGILTFLCNSNGLTTQFELDYE